MSQGDTVKPPEGERAPDYRDKLEELGKRLEEAMERVDAAAAPLMERWGIR